MKIILIRSSAIYVSLFQHCQALGPSRPPDGGPLPGAVGDGEEADRLGWQATSLRAWGTEVFLVC